MKCMLNQHEIKELDFSLNTLKEDIQRSDVKIDSLILAIPVSKIQKKDGGKVGMFGMIKSNFIGNQLLIYLPITADEAFINKQKLLNLTINAIKYGWKLGIKYISLGGVIPSATNYGLDIIDKLKLFPSLNNIKLTTSHGTTLACITINCYYILNKTKRKMRNEIIGILGCGSIGYGSILTIISTLNSYNYPKKIILCDIRKQLNRLIMLKNKLNGLGYNINNIDIIISDLQTTNDLFYECTLIIGATNKSNILDPYKLRKGCIIIDDSEPHCYDELNAWNRFKNKKDILFTEAGCVQLIGDQYRIWDKQYFPLSLPKNKIWSCGLGAMLLHRFPNDMPAIIGPVSYQHAIKIFKLLKKIGINGSIFPHQSLKQFNFETNTKSISKL